MKIYTVCNWLLIFFKENGGASDDPCSNAFAGPTVWSDVEPRNVRDFLQSISPRLVFYLSLHAYGQKILFPTGLNPDPIPNYDRYVS